MLANLCLLVVQAVFASGICVFSARWLSFGMDTGGGRSWQEGVLLIASGFLTGLVLWYLGILGSTLSTKIKRPAPTRLVWPSVMAIVGMIFVYFAIEASVKTGAVRFWTELAFLIGSGFFLTPLLWLLALATGLIRPGFSLLLWACVPVAVGVVLIYLAVESVLPWQVSLD